MPDNPQQTTEQRLQSVAEKSNLTVREIKELVFQYQREQNKQMKEENDEQKLVQERMVELMNGTRIENEKMRLSIEYSELKPVFERVKKGKSPRKKFLFF
jgi:hypothetical protein